MEIENFNESIIKFQKQFDRKARESLKPFEAKKVIIKFKEEHGFISESEGILQIPNKVWDEAWINGLRIPFSKILSIKTVKR